MAVEIANSGKKIKFDTIDKWDGGVELKKHAEDLNNKVQELFLKNIEPVKDFVNVVTGDSHEVYKNYEDESIDFLFIDGSHQYEDVKKDIELWFPKIKRDGVIAGNSYFGGWSGISKAVDEYFGRENISLPNEVWTVHKTDFLNKSIEDKYPEQVVNYRGVIINKKGYWMNDVLMEESFDESLFKELTSVFKDKMVLDLGCGHGYYTKRLLDNGIYCEGYDGNPNTEKLTNGVCKVQDLTVDFNFKKKFDWILCLEVGEHIPTNYEEIFINNLDRNCKDGIVLSWAVVGQGGDGHVNCKSNEDVKKIFEAKGYYNDMELENRLREKAEIHWFKNSLMVFRKSKISIIIPTYNRKEELKECIDSVLNQNYENMEILVCHDGNSLEYDKFKENYTDKRIKFYNTYHQRNNLGASQRNMMLEKVTGNWVLFLDDDNILFNNYLKRMTMEIDDNTAMIVCRIYFNDKEWNNLILPIEDKLIPAQIDHLSILFRADIAKQLMWDNDWGQDHRYINACESIAVSKDLKIKYISDVLADHRYLKPKDYSEELVIVYNNGNIDSFISNMRNYNRKILLTSNNGVDIEIQKKVDYFFLSNNKIILDNFYNCIDFGKNLGFKRFICISSDNDINFMDIDNKMSDIKIKGNKFYYFNKTFFLAIS
jgi:glycosyltransferase involved in cell wall biosynthesis